MFLNHDQPMHHYPKLAQFKTVESFQSRLGELDLSIPMDREILTATQNSPLGQTGTFGRHHVGNRWCIHPMEGWDARADGFPSEHTLRRWKRFGVSGAKLIWGGEAAAVQPDGRANPAQTLASAGHVAGLRALREALLAGHREWGGTIEDLCVGLQLTHSGRFSRPHSRLLEPRIAYHHPLLDRKFGIHPDDPGLVWTDEELEGLIESYVEAAKAAEQAGFQFVDIKACHGYLLHEFLSARRRPGPFGGDFAGRTRLLKSIIQRVRSACPDLEVAVRLSVFDSLPFEAGEPVGRPMEYAAAPYDCGFGLNPENPLQIDLAEPLQLMKELAALGVVGLNLSCGSPYYNPHIQRPAIFPPSDGYLPPEDPLVGVARQLNVTLACKAELRKFAPHVAVVGTGYSYLQDYLPHVAQAVIRNGGADYIGLGRMVLSYPELPRDTLQRGVMSRKKICRTFSDCTTAPRNQLISGCYPLDEYYKQRPEYAELQQIKRKSASRPKPE